MTAEGKRSWLGILKSQGEPDDGKADLHGGLWKAYGQAQHGATRLLESSGQVLASAARQQALIDAIMETIRDAANRRSEIDEPLERIATALDRLHLVALNIGLEGARLDDPAGRALMNVSEEVRGHGGRSAEALGDLRAALGDCLQAWERVERSGVEIEEAHATIVSLVGEQQATAQQVVHDVEEVGQHARAVSDTDPETERILAQAADHARGLIQTLGSLSGRVRHELVRSALGPSLQPLLRVLLDIAKSSKGDKSTE